MKNIFFTSFLFYLFLVLYSIVGSSLIDAGNDYQTQLIKDTPATMMILLFFLGAFFETLIFNLVLILFLKKIFKEKINAVLTVVIASVIFGLGHFSSIQFFFVTSIVGLILNLNFFIYLRKFNDYFLAFVSTFLVHFLSNTTVFLIDECFHLI